MLSGPALASPVSGPPRDATGPDLGPVPVLTLSLTPSQLQAEVTQSQLGAVTFGGTVTVDQMRLMSSTVTMTAVVNTGWPVVISPQTIEFQGPGSEDFQVSVIVPPATSALLTGNVIVTGACKAPGLAPVVAACSGVVTVAPYYIGRIVASDGEVTVDAGEKESLDVTVYNDGNTPAQMRIYAVSLPDEVRISFSETEFQVGQQEAQPINVTVSARSGASSGVYETVLVLEAETREGGTVRVTSFNLSVYLPSLKAKLGFSGMVTIVVIVAVATGVVVLWRMGKLRGLKGIRLPRRSKPSPDTGE